MRPRLLLAVLALAGCLTAAAQAASTGNTVTVTWPTDRPLNVLYVGDSITDGGAVTDWHNKFQLLTLAWLQEHGDAAAILRGKGGVRVAYWAVRKMPTDVDLAVVELGTNDLYKVNAPTPAQLAAFDTSYRRLISSIRTQSPAAKIVCLSVWHPLGQPGSPVPYNTTIKRDCPGAYVPVTDLGQSKSRIASDAFHPNDAGHQAISARVEHAIHVG